MKLSIALRPLLLCVALTAGLATQAAPPAGLLAAATPAVSTPSGSRALVIGVGQFTDPAIPALPGIDVDVEMMRGVLSNLGIAERDVRVLEDEQATLANVERAFKEFLVDGTKPGDRVVVYFSGHGSSMADASGDEEDGADEFLVLHDTRKSDTAIDNVLVDDELGGWLSLLPDREVLVLIDACHSGTATKGMPLTKSLFPTTQTRVPKLWSHDRLVAANTRDSGLLDAARRGAGSSGEGSGYVALMAAQDNQTADATADGSVFTRGLDEAVRNARSEDRTLTAADLRDSIAAFVQRVGASNRPNALSEPATLVSKRVIVERPDPVRSEPGATWNNLQALVKGSSGEVSLEASAAAYKPGELLKLNVSMPADGFLYVLAVSKSDDEAAVLYPSCCSGNNFYKAGETARIPDSERWQRSWELYTKESKGAGDNLIVAIVSEKELALRASGFGESKDLVVGLSPKGLMDLRQMFQSKGLARYPMAGKVEVVVQ